MIRILLTKLLVLSYVICSGQLNTTFSDSTLEGCIKNFFIENRRNKTDTAIVFFKPYKISLKKTYGAEGVGYGFARDLDPTPEVIDTSTLKYGFIINKSLTFDSFLGFFVSDKGVTNNVKTNTIWQNGTFSYVFLSSEDFLQFHLDSLLGYDSLYIRPVIDLLEVSNNVVKHTRYQITCCHTNQRGFFISLTSILKEATFKL